MGQYGWTLRTWYEVKWQLLLLCDINNSNSEAEKDGGCCWWYQGWEDINLSSESGGSGVLCYVNNKRTIVNDVYCILESDLDYILSASSKSSCVMWWMCELAYDSNLFCVDQLCWYTCVGLLVRTPFHARQVLTCWMTLLFSACILWNHILLKVFTTFIC